MSEKLLPCPFCGRPATFYMPDHGDSTRSDWAVICEGRYLDAPDCWCGAETQQYPTKEEAAAAWNRRPREDRLVKPLIDIRKRVGKKAMLCSVVGGIKCVACPDRTTCDEAIMIAAIDAALKKEM